MSVSVYKVVVADMCSTLPIRWMGIFALAGSVNLQWRGKIQSNTCRHHEIKEHANAAQWPSRERREIIHLHPRRERAGWGGKREAKQWGNARDSFIDLSLRLSLQATRPPGLMASGRMACDGLSHVQPLSKQDGSMDSFRVQGHVFKAITACTWYIPSQAVPRPV
ncbi:hypothetical protein B0H14DRAFT_2623127 [Mycena olivaceomarginata]|nr:hypothetical protein B0H14DRAFT_2623127 [Mycena olivaceomarginata]